jgi:hypothetical protein
VQQQEDIANSEAPSTMNGRPRDIEYKPPANGKTGTIGIIDLADSGTQPNASALPPV